MAGSMSSVEGVFSYFLTPILPNIGGETTREGLIDLHQLVSGNAASVVLNLVGGQHRHLALMMTVKDYMAQTGFSFVPPHKPGDYPQITGNS